MSVNSCQKNVIYSLEKLLLTFFITDEQFVNKQDMSSSLFKSLTIILVH